jgi:hypothetical protein
MAFSYREKLRVGFWRKCVQPPGAMSFLIACVMLGILKFTPVHHTFEHTPMRNVDNVSWKFVAMYRGTPSPSGLNKPSASQVGQDMTIAEIFGFKHGGTFVDLAANHAITFSNSMVLEQKYNWTGLCIEPNPIYAESYIHRRCQLVQAVVGPQNGLKVDFNFAGTLGGVMGFDNKQSNSTQSHYTVSVAKILQDFGMPKTIDYLSLDIEGAEGWAFETFPWEEIIFLTLTVERPKGDLKITLQDNGYVFVCLHGSFGDELWVHKSFGNLPEVMRVFGQQKQCRDRVVA